MSDGPSDCAMSAYDNSIRFIEARWPKEKMVDSVRKLGREGTFVLFYEEWLVHVVELVVDGVVTERWLVGPFDRKPYQMKDGGESWWTHAGHFEDHSLPPEVREAMNRANAKKVQLRRRPERKAGARTPRAEDAYHDGPPGHCDVPDRP